MRAVIFDLDGVLVRTDRFRDDARRALALRRRVWPPVKSKPYLSFWR